MIANKYSFGAIGIPVVFWGSGQRFDLIGPSTPFIAVGAANAVVCIAAVMLRTQEQNAVAT